MSIFDDFLTRFPLQTEPGENEYMGDDGLLYCSKCKTPVQCRVKIGSVKITDGENTYRRLHDRNKMQLAV
ncbi:MAG: hypothetical protein LUH58_10140 [Lachnospiraceae bacterium]|nr:hypothetical protein [Lachnospiraceae bacterium]